MLPILQVRTVRCLIFAPIFTGVRPDCASVWCDNFHETDKPSQRGNPCGHQRCWWLQFFRIRARIYADSPDYLLTQTSSHTTCTWVIILAEAYTLHRTMAAFVVE